MYRGTKNIDGDKTYKDEGTYPTLSGSYHLYHRIDGKLIAVNVWDLTENTLGCIYTFYDPAYRQLSIGHVTAVREIEWMLRVRRLHNPNLRYYYMGYYVNEC